MLNKAGCVEFLSSYGLFLVEIITVLAAVVIGIVAIIHQTQRKRLQSGHLNVIHLGERYRKMKDEMILARMKPYEKKEWNSSRKKQAKQEAKIAKQHAKQGLKNKNEKATLYVLDFKGSMNASEVTSLREEISAVLAVASADDEVLLRLESAGGVVHGYGLASSQLQRLRQKNIRLTVAVDKVAASGGYMMACVADHIAAAPFSIIGSIGVVAQIPNFNRWLKRNDIDVELHTAGEYKRTLTLFGENNEQGREKFCEDLQETHQLFKQFVQKMRPALDIDGVATGKHWFGSQAFEKGLIDSLTTSDDLIISAMDRFNVLSVCYVRRKGVIDRFTNSTVDNAARLLSNLWQRNHRPLL